MAKDLYERIYVLENGLCMYAFIAGTLKTDFRIISSKNCAF